MPNRFAPLVLTVALWLPTAAAAQQTPPPTANPLATLYDALQQALAETGVPLSPEQQRAIVLMMEDRRKASEELFGDLMDFRSGPTQGEQEDRLRSAIEWMRGEFLRNVAVSLTPEQGPAWQAFLADQATSASAQTGAAADDQTQYVRIHNNAFTAEQGGFSGGDGFTEVISRGGRGAWHGNVQLLLKDDALNARNPFAENEPSYQERRISADASGPAIAQRLTTSVAVTSVETENVSAVRATLPDGELALGITRPHTFRRLEGSGTLQLASSHSLRTNAWFAHEAGRDQGIGDFTLPERGHDFDWRGGGLNVQHFSVLPSAALFELRGNVERNSGETAPHTHGIRINVLDAFNGGGAQNSAENRNRSYTLHTMFTRTGDVFTVKTGVEGAYFDQHRRSENNFAGTFTFSSIDDYLNGRPINYRVNVGTPLLHTTQFEGSAFVQVDAAVTSQLTLMLGARYDAQTNLDDYNNLSPRISFGYAPGRATVIRGGGGLFYNRLGIGMVETQRRFDGTRQFEIIVDNPSYPDPFGAGTLRQTFPSVRVTAPDLQASRLAIGMLSIERTFLSTLLLSVSYDFQREYGRMRTRDLNAPVDATSPVLRACQPGQPDETCVRPDPTRGQVLNLESTGKEVRHNVSVEVRQRFRWLNLSAEYELEHVYGDVQGGPGTLSTDSHDPDADWGRAPFPPHSVDVTANVRLPLDVFVAARMDASSGRSYSITTGLDDNRDGNITDRPPGVAPNTARGPAYLDFDFNISKAFFLRGSGAGPNINVFANMTNAFNRVHYGTPSGVLTSPNFGRSTSASDPREIEAGIRFQF